MNPANHRARQEIWESNAENKLTKTKVMHIEQKVCIIIEKTMYMSR